MWNELFLSRTLVQSQGNHVLHLVELLRRSCAGPRYVAAEVDIRQDKVRVSGSQGHNRDSECVTHLPELYHLGPISVDMTTCSDLST